jgi:NAD(P)-dependent dehydrogenase (short-subunit alcohol dehydrogenase family)
VYAASKHAVRGFTDALRVKVAEVDRNRVAITLIHPTAVDTPFPQHARNYMDREPKLPAAAAGCTGGRRRKRNPARSAHVATSDRVAAPRHVARR